MQRKEPVSWANLRYDPFQSIHSEWPFHEGAVQKSEIENGPKATTLLGGEEVAAVEA